MKPRLGAVPPYLNTQPLVVALERDPATFALSYLVPSRCARELADGTIDVGIIPVIEYARSARPYWIVPDIAIGSQGSVVTVRLFCRRPLPQVERIALDTSSRTSVALLSILLREKFALAPQLIEAPPDLEAMLECADAALLIGDQVFPHLDGELESLDLGREWTAMTDLPFVFAFWAGRISRRSHPPMSNNCSEPKIRGYVKRRLLPQRTAGNAAARPSSTSAT